MLGIGIGVVCPPSGRTKNVEDLLDLLVSSSTLPKRSCDLEAGSFLAQG
jgi:hypothetical protein